MSEIEAAKATVLIAEGKVSEILALMENCPFEDPLDRVASAVEVVSLFNEGQAQLLAAVAINRLGYLVSEIQKIAGISDAG